MAETILVTGATGAVGSEVVKQLLSAKGERKDIKAAARSANDSTFRNLGVQVLELDYNKPDTLSAALSGVDKLFLLTPFQSNMVELTSNLVNEAKKADVKYIVKQSVLGADDAEQSITHSIYLARLMMYINSLTILAHLSLYLEHNIFDTLYNFSSCISVITPILR